MGDIADEMLNRHYGDEDDEQPTLVECSRCGKGGLEWEDDNGVWKLLDRHGKVHVCRSMQLRDGDFDVVTDA